MGSMTGSSNNSCIMWMCVGNLPGSANVSCIIWMRVGDLTGSASCHLSVSAEISVPVFDATVM